MPDWAKPHFLRIRRFPLRLFVLVLCSAFASAQEIASADVIRHDPVPAFKYGDIVDIRATALAEVDALRLFFRYKDIKEFQVRTMERREDRSFGFKIDTGELPSPDFEYYLAAVLSERTVTLPADPSQELFHARGTIAEVIPEAPAEIPPSATPAEKPAPFAWPVEATGSLQATLRDLQAASDAPTIKGSGNVRIFTNLRKNRTALDFSSNFALSSQASGGQKALDLSNLSLSLTAGRHAFVAGDVSVNESEYSVSGLGRRGLDYAYRDQRAAVHFFSVNSQQMTGFQGFGLPRKNANILGGAFGYKFFGEGLSLKAVYLAGGDDPQLGRNVGSASNYRPRQGDVLALSEEARLFKNKLTLTGEFARSRFDADTTDDLSSKSDTAFRLGGILSQGKLMIGAAYRFVGKDFNSVGFSYFTNNRRNIDAQVGLNLGRITLNGTCLYSRDNVENDPAASTTKTVQINSALMWSIAPKLSFNLTYLRNQQRTDSGREQFSFSQDSASHQWMGTVNWTLGAANMLSCSLTSAHLGSRNNPLMGSRNFVVAMNGSFRSGSLLSLSPTLSYAVMKYESAGTATRTLSSFIAAEASLLPRLLSAAVTGSYMSMTSDPDQFSRNLLLAGQVNLSSERFLKKGKIVLSLRGNYSDARSNYSTSAFVSWFLQTDISF